jgi:hypothetical protein
MSMDEKCLNELDYLKLCTINKCKWDGALLNSNIDHYQHNGGWMLSNFSQKQWLSRHCSKCGYDWSLNKLGVPRE